MISALGEGIMTIADGPEMPSINDFLPDPFVFQGTPFAINRIILVRKEAKLPKKQFRALLNGVLVQDKDTLSLIHI